MPSPKPSPSPSPEDLVIEFNPESLGNEDEGEEVGTDVEAEEVRTDDEDEEVKTDDVEEILGVTEAADARRMLKWPLLNLGRVSPGLKIAMKKVEVSFMFCFSVNTLQGQELVFETFPASSRFVLVLLDQCIWRLVRLVCTRQPTYIFK